MKGPKRHYSVALLVESSNSFGRELLRGISAYILGGAPWSVALAENEAGFEQLSWFSHWKGDGVIARITNRTIARRLNSLGVPIVNVSSQHHSRGHSEVLEDNDTISRLAIEHLQDCGFSRVAYCGDSRFRWSQERCKYFRKYAAIGGLDCFNYSSRSTSLSSWFSEHEQLREWVRSLPLPIGVMASHDLHGRQLLAANQAERISVPEQLAVIGVDNDELVCNFCEPKLSSVIPDAFQSGYQAAAILNDSMVHPQRKPRELRIPPRGVAVRQSSDIVAFEDVLVSRALKFIRQHACDGISVTDVVRTTDVSRGTLDNRFQRVLGRSVHAEIERVRMKRIKLLLTETTLPLESIAHIVGFRHPEYMNVSFKRYVGTTPGQYRLDRESALESHVRAAGD